jgi:hypothetical protein
MDSTAHDFRERTMMKAISWICVLVLQIPLISGGVPAPVDHLDLTEWEGRWALDPASGGAGWLGVDKDAGFWDARLLWSGGAVAPVASVVRDGEALQVTRLREIRRTDSRGGVVRVHQLTETFRMEREGDSLRGVRSYPVQDGSAILHESFTGRRISALPSRPDLNRVTFAEPVSLFNGRDLGGWALADEGHQNGWSVSPEGWLINRPIPVIGGPLLRFGNLRTLAEFVDFNLTLEVRVPVKGNSGVYLRGIYEVQVADSQGKEGSALNMGAIYSRIPPSVRAEKAAGEWQALDITLVRRHVTVILNGVTVIDNQPLEGITGGALWSDESRPGPIFLQGDHTGVDYRNLVLRPVVHP